MTDGSDEEELDAVVVLADEVRAVQPEPPVGALSPVVAQTVAVVGVGVVAGAAMMAIAQRRRTKRLARRQRSALGSIIGSRSFLVDVHVLSDRK